MKSPKARKPNTKLLTLCVEGGIEAARKRIKKGDDVDSKDDEGWSPLHIASINGHGDIVDLLFENGASVDAKTDSQSDTALHLATTYGHMTIVKSLLVHKAPIDEQNKLGRTALHIAAEYSKDDIVKLLIEKQADVNMKDEVGYTPLHIAAAKLDKAVVRSLLDGGADRGAKDNKDNTPFKYTTTQDIRDLLRDEKEDAECNIDAEENLHRNNLLSNDPNHESDIDLIGFNVNVSGNKEGDGDSCNDDSNDLDCRDDEPGIDLSGDNTDANKHGGVDPKSSDKESEDSNEPDLDKKSASFFADAISTVLATPHTNLESSVSSNNGSKGSSSASSRRKQEYIDAKIRDLEHEQLAKPSSPSSSSSIPSLSPSRRQQKYIDALASLGLILYNPNKVSDRKGGDCIKSAQIMISACNEIRASEVTGNIVYDNIFSRDIDDAGTLSNSSSESIDETETLSKSSSENIQEIKLSPNTKVGKFPTKHFAGEKISFKHSSKKTSVAEVISVHFYVDVPVYTIRLPDGTDHLQFTSSEDAKRKNALRREPSSSSSSSSSPSRRQQKIFAVLSDLGLTPRNDTHARNDTRMSDIGKVGEFLTKYSVGTRFTFKGRSKKTSVAEIMSVHLDDNIVVYKIKLPDRTNHLLESSEKAPLRQEAMSDGEWDYDEEEMNSRIPNGLEDATTMAGGKSKDDFVSWLAVNGIVSPNPNMRPNNTKVGNSSPTKYHVGQKIGYRDSSGALIDAEITSIHLDDNRTRYFKVRLQNGTERIASGDLHTKEKTKVGIPNGSKRVGENKIRDRRLVYHDILFCFTLWYVGSSLKNFVILLFVEFVTYKKWFKRTYWFIMNGRGNVLGNALATIVKPDFGNRPRTTFQKLDTFTRFLMGTAPGSIIDCTLKPPTDDDIKSENIDIGWECGKNKDGRKLSDWKKKPAKATTVEMSSNLSIDIVTEDDITGKPPLSNVTNGFLRDKIFPLIDKPNLFFKCNEEAQEMLDDLKITMGKVIPKPYNECDDMTTDESLTRIFFYGMGAVLIAAQPNDVSSDLGEIIVEMPLEEFRYRPGFRPLGATIYFDKNQKPTAIFDPIKKVIFKPGEEDEKSQEEWEQAKFLVRATVGTLVTMREHLLWSHLIISNSVTKASINHLQPCHPIRRLLTIFTYNTNAVNSDAFGALVPRMGIFHRASAFKYESMKDIFYAGYKASNIFEPFGNRKVCPAVQKISDEGKFPYLSEGMAYYEVVRTFVQEWLDEAEWKDMFSEAFYNAVKKDSQGQSYQLPEYDEDGDMMTNLLTQMIFVVTAYNELAGGVVDYFRLPTRFGFRCTENATQMDVQSFLLSTMITGRTSVRMPSLMSDFNNFFGVLGPSWERNVWDNFQGKLKIQSENIQKADAKREIEYKAFNPARFECSISV